MGLPFGSSRKYTYISSHGRGKVFPLLIQYNPPAGDGSVRLQCQSPSCSLNIITLAPDPVSIPGQLTGRILDITTYSHSLGTSVWALFPLPAIQQKGRVTLFASMKLNTRLLAVLRRLRYVPNLFSRVQPWLRVTLHDRRTRLINHRADIPNYRWFVNSCVRGYINRYRC
jgi:hypothetical protein